MVKDKKVLPHLSSYANDPERIEEQANDHVCIHQRCQNIHQHTAPPEKAHDQTRAQVAHGFFLLGNARIEV